MSPRRLQDRSAMSFTPGPLNECRSLTLLALFGVALAAVPACSGPNRVADPGSVELRSSHPALNRGFAWAKRQALAYAFDDDPVGPWFEAALPGREAFCMRDVSHQSAGAMALGLWPHTRNMFRRFAESIDGSRDWASFWEINRHGDPAPVDYRSDEDFWYNLPANFDVIQAIRGVYEWTGDEGYLQDPVFLEFYRRSLDDYVDTWDINEDGLMDSPPENGIRGIPTYWEGEGPRAFTGADLVAAQYAGNRAAAAIMELRGDGAAAAKYREVADGLKAIYNQDWWNPETGRFNTALLPDGSFDSSPLPLGQLYPLYFGIVDPGSRRDRMVQTLPDGGMVELNAYLPEIFYRNGFYQRAFKALMDQMDPDLPRREYPEVSFTAVGHVVGFLMGLRPRASEGVVETKPRLPPEVDWAEVGPVPVWAGTVSVRHEGRNSTAFRNQGGRSLLWRAVFPGNLSHLLLNGGRQVALSRQDPGEGPESYLEVEVAPGSETVVRVPEGGIPLAPDSGGR